MNDVAALLNSGVLRSASNNSLADLGMYASGSGGNLTFSTGSGNFVSTGSGVPTISAGIGGVSAVVAMLLLPLIFRFLRVRDGISLVRRLPKKTLPTF